MKLIKELDREEIKKIEKLLDVQPDLLEMLQREKARTTARKIIQPLILIGLGLLVFGFVVYALPLINRLIIIIDSAPQ